jgi:hypothetical protein
MGQATFTPHIIGFKWIHLADIRGQAHTDDVLQVCLSCYAKDSGPVMTAYGSLDQINKKSSWKRHANCCTVNELLH